MNEIEVFKDVLGFEGLYKIGNLGTLVSLPKKHKIGKLGGMKQRPQIIKKACVDRDGYLNTTLTKDGKVYNKKIHRLVAEVFVANPNNSPTVNHEDGNKANNKASNLSWASSSDQNFHAYRTGLRKDWGIASVAKKGSLAAAKKKLLTKVIITL